MDKSVFVLKGFKGLGTVWFAELFLQGLNADVSLIEERLKKEIEEFENKYSRFQEESLLNQLNKNKSIQYDKDLVKMLEIAKEASLKSGGIFNIFIKEKLENKGYGKKVTEVSQGETSEASATELVGDKIILRGNKGIDLGGIGKGYLIDKLANILSKEFGIKYFLVNGGGDIYVTSNNEEKIEIFLEHPTKQGEYIYKIKIKDKAFCSSSSFKRMWLVEDKEVNHFIGDDEEVWASSYVISDGATNADIFATVACLISSNKDKLIDYSKDFNVDYFVINKEGNIYRSNNFPELSV